MVFSIPILSLFLCLPAIFCLECGQFTSLNNILETRIVNGELATLGEFPWQVSIQRRVRVKLQEANTVLSDDKLVISELSEDDILDGTLWGKSLWPKLVIDSNSTYGQIINWPPTHPPLPTHPPHITIPPLPTHPPHHTFPPLPTHPPFKPASKVPWMPPAPKPWPPHQNPPKLPPLPELPPIPTLPPGYPPRPTGVPTLPPFPGSTKAPKPSLPPIPTSAPRPKPTLPPKPRPPIDKSKKWQHFCGGSIIDNYWILTAAHCVESMKYTYTPGTIQIVAGSTDWRNVDETYGQVISVDRIIVHNGWTQQSGQNDVALLHLSSPIQYVQDDKIIVNKVCLSRETLNEHSGMATSSGWGFLNKDHRVTPELMRRVDIPVVDHFTCKNAFSRVIGISQNQVCAGQAPKGNCMGDSGGPLVQKSGNSATQIGIVSFSIPCAVPGYPDVFTRVSKYIDWIINNTGLSL